MIFLRRITLTAHPPTSNAYFFDIIEIYDEFISNSSEVEVEVSRHQLSLLNIIELWIGFWFNYFKFGDEFIWS